MPLSYSLRDALQINVLLRGLLRAACGRKGFPEFGRAFDALDDGEAYAASRVFGGSLLADVREVGAFSADMRRRHQKGLVLLALYKGVLRVPALVRLFDLYESAAVPVVLGGSEVSTTPELVFGEASERWAEFVALTRAAGCTTYDVPASSLGAYLTLAAMTGEILPAPARAASQTPK